MTTTTRAETTDADYEAYQTIAQIVSRAFSDSITESLNRLASPESLHQAVTEAAAANGEAAPDESTTAALYRGFWTYAKGLETSFRWRSTTGVPERGYVDVRQVEPAATTEFTPEFSIGGSFMGVSLGVSW